MAAEETAKKQRGRPFVRGQSGNPAGRPFGSRNRTTLAVDVLLDGEAERLTRKAVALALKGNVACLRLCLDRIAPPRRDPPVFLPLRALQSADDASMAMAEIAAAVASGKLTPAEASGLSHVVEAYLDALATTEFERRLKALEEQQQTSWMNEKRKTA
jgi:hypothetical protein